MLYSLPLGSEDYCWLDSGIEGDWGCSFPMFLYEYARCSGNCPVRWRRSQFHISRGEDSWASCWFLEMAHSLGFLSELIQLAFGTDKDFGISIFLTLPLARWRIRSLVVESWHCGEADDWTVALHSLRNFDTPKLNLLGLVQGLILFDSVHCGFQFCGIVLYLFLAVHDELFVCFVPLLGVLWFIWFLVPIRYISFDEF